MKRRLSLRVKLLAIVAIPLAALLVISTTTALDRLRAAASANDLAERTTDVVTALSLVRELQSERGLTNGLLAGGDEAARQRVADQRRKADTALATYRDAVARLSGTTLASFADTDTRLAGLADIRRRVDAKAITAPESLDWYTGTITSLIDAGTASLLGLGITGDATRSVVAFDALARASEATALERGLMNGVFTAGAFSGDQYRRYVTLRATQSAWYVAHAEVSTAAEEQRVADAVASATSAMVRSARSAADGATATTRFEVDPATWFDDMTVLVDVVLDARDAEADRAVALVEAERASAAQARNVYLAVAAASVALIVAIGLLLGRWVRRPIGELIAEAVAVASERLPAAVRAAAAGEEAPALPPVALRTGDELEDLADAFNRVQSTAVALATEQAAMRRNVGDTFVSLGRRNQSLLARQLGLIDALESREADPELLEELFRLDHLATRMRRNAESLLVLAGTEPARVWSAPVTVLDTLRAAIGEVEDFTRVEVRSLAEVSVLGAAASDLSHLLAELLENATQFSPPTAKVTVTGRQRPEGYVISIVDQGIGMTEDELAEANERIASPPAFELAPSRYLGLFVVGRLAARYGVAVRLHEADSGGTTARVVLPASVLALAPNPAEQPLDPSPAVDHLPDADDAKVIDLRAPAMFAERPPVSPVFEPAPQPMVPAARATLPRRPNGRPVDTAPATEPAPMRGHPAAPAPTSASASGSGERGVDFVERLEFPDAVASVPPPARPAEPGASTPSGLKRRPRPAAAAAAAAAEPAPPAATPAPPTGGFGDTRSAAEVQDLLVRFRRGVELAQGNGRASADHPGENGAHQ